MSRYEIERILINALGWFFVMCLIVLVLGLAYFVPIIGIPNAIIMSVGALYLYLTL